MACWHPTHRCGARPPPPGATRTSVASNHRPSALRTPLPVRQGCARRPTPCGPCCSRAYSSPCPWSARAASQTAYGACDRPATLRITYPPHPLAGSALKVVGHRREGDRIYWVVELVDGSHLRVPSFWTDHPTSADPLPRPQLGTRATPQALRELAEVIEHLAPRSSPPDARAHPNNAGQGDARATRGQLTKRKISYVKESDALRSSKREGV